jgi:hypothetical protein
MMRCLTARGFGTWLLFVVVIGSSVSSAFAVGNLCDDAKETPSMSRARLEEFFNHDLRGNSCEGKGVVREVRLRGGTESIVVVDCLNDVIANVIVSSSSVRNVKVGEEVGFSGRCSHTYRWAYRDANKAYQIIELQSGNIR